MRQRLYNGVYLTDRPAPNNVKRLDMGTLSMISTMMRTGMRLDTGHLLRLKARWSEEMAELNEAANIMTGYETNLRSDDDVAELLFRKIGIKTRHRIKLTDSQKREQVDADQLELIRDAHPVVPIILSYRQLSKLVSTYTSSLIRLISPEDQRLHTEILTTRTATGRLASKKPNLQNIPIRTKEGALIRKAFVPEPGNCIGSIDMSQIELRVMASERNVPKMLQVFWDDGDLHSETAIDVFNRDRQSIYLAEKLANDHGKDCKCASCAMYAEFRWRQRMPCKNVNFGIVYEISPPGLATLIATSGGDQEYWTESRCEGVIAKWYDIYPEVLTGSKLQAQRARRFGMVWDAFGRVRLVPEVKSIHFWIVSQGLRQVANMHIQAMAAGILKLAMAEIYDGWREYGWDRFIKILMQIHDELLFEGERRAMEDFLHWCGGIIEKCCPLKVPIKYGIAISEESWGHLSK